MENSQLGILPLHINSFIQGWLDKAKTIKNSSCDGEKKRKRDETDSAEINEGEPNTESASKKKPFSQSTNSKLSAFAFSKS